MSNFKLLGWRTWQKKSKELPANIVSYGNFVPTKVLSFPERDKHFSKYDHYQREIYEAALEHTKNRNLAIDVGAHCGIFTLYMERDFAKVHAFEPVQENFMCLQMNINNFAVDRNKVHTHGNGLSEISDIREISNVCAGNSGAWEIRKTNDVRKTHCMLAPMDLYVFKPDLIKLDVQGHELNVLLGAESTINRCKPTLIVELWEETDTKPLTDYIDKELEYKIVHRHNKDVVAIAK